MRRVCVGVVTLSAALASCCLGASEALGSGWSSQSAPLSASAGAAPSISFASSPGNSAGWVKGIDAPGDTDGQAIRLSFATSGSATASLGSVGSSPPSSPPSFLFRPALGFSPSPNVDNALAYVQVVIDFSDSVTVSSTFQGDMWSPWTADPWRLVGGPHASWGDDACLDPGCGDGGSHPIPPCRYVGGTGPSRSTSSSYQQAIACPLADGATVTGASVRAAFWGQGRGPDMFVDDLRYDGAEFTTGGPGTVVSVANPWPPPSLVGIASVNRRTGRGTVRAHCPTTWLAPCFFALALAVKRNGVRVGTVTGTVWGQFGKVAVHLNRKGRALLRANGTRRLIVSGTWPGGTPVKTGTRLAVKAVRPRA